MASSSDCIISPISPERWNFSGLAVIVTNDYSTSHCSGPLAGTERDGEQLTKAFKRFNFDVWHHRNVNCNALESLIRKIASLPYSHVKDYSCFIFIFAGHGNKEDRLFLQDDKLVDPMECIVRPLLPGRCKQLGDIPKIFLIDACRGLQATETILVPRGSECHDNEKANLNEAMEERGGKLLEYVKLPSESNFLVAQSTMPRHKAYENTKIGGIWFSTLAKFMLELEQKMSIDDILTNVNDHMMQQMQSCGEYFQQPDKHSRLNKIVYLRPVYKAVPTLAATFNRDVCQQSTIDTTQQPIPYISLLERYLVSRGVQAQYGVHPCVVKEYGDVPFYQGIVTLRSSTHLLQPYKSSNCYLTIGQAHEEAAKIAYFSLMERYHSAIPDQAGTIESTMPSHSAAVSSVVQDTLGSASFDSSEDGSRAISNVSSVDHSYPSGGVINPHSSQLSNGAAVSASAVVQPKVSTSTSKKPNYRSQFHEYCQKEGLKPRYDFIEDESGPSTIFKCTISFTQNGSSVRADSNGFYLRKDESKEVACYKMLSKVIQPIQSRGAVSDSVSWKSKLKEFYDKRGEPNTQLQYQTRPVGSLCYESSVFVKELGKNVGGSTAKSKKEAEQNAAQTALRLLRKTKLL